VAEGSQTGSQRHRDPPAAPEAARGMIGDDSDGQSGK
jgi:hypothetical protein